MMISQFLCILSLNIIRNISESLVGQALYNIDKTKRFSLFHTMIDKINISIAIKSI
jgi:hypothetical protein